MAETVGGVSYSVDVDYGDLNTLESAVDKSTKEMAKDFNNLDKSIGASTQGIKTKATKTASAVTGALSGVGSAAGRVGIQISQFTGQVQGGQNVLLAFSQQIQDIGFQLGVPLLGAVLSVAAAVGISLVAAFDRAKNASKALPEELEKRLEEIKAGFEATDEVSRKAFAQVELGKLNTDLNQITNRINTLKSAQQTYFNLAAKGNNGARLDYKRVGDEIADLEKKLQPLALLQEKVRLETLGIAQEWKSTGDETDKAATAAERFVEQLTLSTTKLNEGEEAALRLSAATALGLTNAEKLPPEVERAIAAYVAARQEAEAEAEFRREILAEQKQAIADIESERKNAHQQELERIRAEDAQRKKLEAVAGGNLGLTRLQQLAQQYEQEKQLLLAAQNAKIESEIAYQDRLTQLEVSYAEARADEIKRIQESQTANTKSALEMAGFSYEQLSNQAIGTFASIAAGAQSGTDAIRSLAQSILVQAIGALIKLAATSAIGQSTAVASGSATAAALSAAYATPAALASLASFGGNAVPAQAGIAATVALSEGIALGGGRLYGGPVDSGKIYPITENGKPEILQQGAKQYLLPGSKGGNVVSNRDMQQASGGMNVQINVQNNTPSNVDVQRRQGPDKTEIIDIVVADIKGRGKTLRAITETTTASNKL